MKAPAGLRKKRHKHAQQQAQQRHPNKAGPIRDVAAPRTAQAPAIYLTCLLCLFHGIYVVFHFAKNRIETPLVEAKNPGLSYVFFTSLGDHFIPHEIS